MFARCANSDCQAPFDYREGQLVRFSASETHTLTSEPRVAHLWLCGRCSETYVLKSAFGKIRVVQRAEEAAG